MPTVARRLRAFVLLVVAGGAGGFLGSIAGAGVGALFAGGIAGGLVTAPCGAMLAGRLRWIDAGDVRATAIGAAVGFLAAVGVAVNTLSSPIGPALSPLLVGVAGLVAPEVQRFLASRPSS